MVNTGVSHLEAPGFESPGDQGVSVGFSQSSSCASIYMANTKLLLNFCICVICIRTNLQQTYLYLIYFLFTLI